MRHMGGCTECFTVWRGCRCPLRCEECGAGYRDDGNSNCGTPGCLTGQRRAWAIQSRWDRGLEASHSEIQCEAIEPAGAEMAPESAGERCPAAPSLADAPDPGGEERNVTPLAPTAGDDATAAPILDPVSEGGAMMAPPLPRSAERRRPAAKGHTERRTPHPGEPEHRPVAERRAAVEALLSEGMSDREIARRVKVSPSTVSAVRKAQQTAKFGA